MDTAITAFELFSDLYGPYPYNRLVIVEGAFPDGMEFTGLVFVGGEWFRLFDGDPASYLTLITAHEIAHQWWYARVANDQSREPWLDEALSTYSEYIYLQEYYPDLADWWWAFRVDGYSPQGYVDSTVYEFSTARAYINAVYLRGAQLLHAIRQNIGGETFFQWLSDYASQMNGKIATAADLWGALPDHLQEQTAGIRTAFLRYPNFR
jgi:aminopeptidase N